MQTTLILSILSLVWLGFLIWVFTLIIRALRKYLREKPRNTTIRRTLGENLRAQRLRCKMTQEFVAERLDVSRQTVTKWENGAAEPSTSHLLALAKLFGVAPEELLRGVEPDS